jgi:amino acid adenylation domain-containing protein
MAEDFFLFPVSFAQQQLWFLDQLAPGSPVYNLPGNVLFKGRLDVRALERSLNEIVRRHEILHTNFQVVDGQPTQVVAPASALALPLTDLQDLPQKKREAEVQRLSVEEGRRSFNLAHDALLRSRLLRLAEDEHVLLLTSHHIVSDGWSLGVFLRELVALYESLTNEKPSPLPELSIQYGDFAVWQRESLSDELLKSHLDYWQQQLGGELPLLELPFDHPRPPVQTAHGARQELCLDRSVTAALKALSYQTGTTLFTVLLSALKVLLYRYAGQTDIIIGTPVAGRNQTETENLIGLFMNTLVLRTELSGNPDFVEVLRRVREVTLAAYEHQDVPFEKLVEELQPERDLSRMPLFQVMFAFQNAPMPSLELSDVTLKLLEVDLGTAKFDLALNLSETSDSVNGYFEYNTDLFERETMARLSQHFQTLLQSIVSTPHSAIASLPLLTEHERQQQLREWNQTTHDYPTHTLPQLFEAQVERTPDATALIFEEQQLSYRELNERANQVGHYLRKLGVVAESLVGLMMERSLEMVVSLLGILKAGGAYVPLDREYPPERLSYMIRESGCRVVMSKGEVADSLAVEGVSVVKVEEGGYREESRENPESNTWAENLAYVIYTSGSTGLPKGVAMQHSPLVNLIEWQHGGLKLSHEAKTLQISSLSFDASFNESFATWRSGGALILISEELRRDAERLLRLIVDQKVERLFLPFVTLQQLAEAFVTSERLPVNVREVLSTAEQLHITQAIAHMFKRLHGCTLYNEYGPSESHVVTAFTLSGSPDDWDALPPIGVPIANTQIYLLDRYLQPVLVGVPGELYIGGANLARGYLNQPAATAEKFIPNPFGDKPGARLYKTGDLARYLPDGNIKYLGRMDEQVKLRGFRVELGEVEAVLTEHDEVREAVVVAHGTTIGDKRLVAYIIAEHEQAPPNTSELRAHLKKKLPEYMVPSAFVVLSEMPLTPSGKVDRRALPEPSHLRPEIESEYVAPRSTAEQLLAEMWARVLKLERVGIRDNFFEIGGHSLLATQLISHVRDVFRLELPLRRLFEEPTPEGLLKEIAQAWGGMEIVEEIARTVKEIEQLPKETVKALLTER